MRIIGSALIILLLSGLAGADVIIVRKGKKIDLVGIKSKIEVNDERIEITPQNVDLYADQSDGVILVDGYNGVEIAKNDRAKKGTFYPRSEIIRVIYSTEPTKLLDGLDNMRLGAWAQAIADFRDVLDNPEVREVYKHEARFQIGLCYYNGGNVRGCIGHYQAWKAVNSKYTPRVQTILAQLYTGQKKFPNARARYANIPKLDGITEVWKYRARLGEVRVDIAERQFKRAEQTAAGIARETRDKQDSRDAWVLAITLQAEAIFRGGEADRLPAAQNLIESARKQLEGVEPSTKATMYLTLGHVIYAQRNPDEARYPYMRAALMFEGSGAEGAGFTNAGLCYLDLSGKAANEGDEKKSDELFISGMRLLGTAAGRYGDREARKHYLNKANKERFDKLMEKEEAEGAPAEKKEGK